MEVLKKFTVINDWEEKKRTIITTEIHDSGKKEITTEIHDFSDDKERTIITTKIHDPEEKRMIHQARLAHRLRRELTRRFLDHGRSSSADSSDGKSSTPVTSTPLFGTIASAELQKHENQRVVTRATNVVLHHPVVGEIGHGILEAQLNGFTYTASDFRMVLENANVDGCFWRLGDVEPPLLQFHLKHPITVVTKETKDIQFCLMPTPPELVEDSDCIRNRASSRNEDLKNFINEVKETQWTCRNGIPITPIYFEALDECQFDGVFPTGKPAIFAVTYSALVVLVGQPFLVVPLDDIEIVNLALIKPEMIHMTVVFKDFKRAVLEICSIRLELLTGIKHRLDYADVKYYVNSESRDWHNLVRSISESPETFIQNGGWESLRLEDNRTLGYYPDADSGSDSENYFNTSI